MKKLLYFLAAAMAAVSCIGNNPFFAEWETPYGIPDFDAVKEKHYLPAVVVGIAQQQAEIEAIIANTEEPTFANVVEAYEKSGAILDRVTGVLFNLSETDATPSLQAIVEKVLPQLSVHSDNIFMNPAFFKKVEVLYNDMENLGLNQEQKMALKKLYNSFVKNGIALGEAEQARMREINMELSSLSNTFGNRLLAENNAFAQEFGVAISEYGGAMAATADRALREKMFKAYSSRGNNGNENDTKELIMKMMALRVEKANLLGYENPAQMILIDKMAGNPETVDAFLAGIIAPAVAKAKAEIVDMQAVMDQDIKAGLLPEGSKIEPWDWAYYTEKVRMAKYALDEEQTKPYFQMENVRQGVFDLTTKLFGLQYEKIEGIAVYHPDVEAFKVSDADGSLIGVILTDYFPRSTKRGGAWMNNFVNQEIIDGVETRPVIVNVGNFAKPVDGKPSLLTLDQVETLFHEYGHALHGSCTRGEWRCLRCACVCQHVGLSRRDCSGAGCVAYGSRKACGNDGSHRQGRQADDGEGSFGGEPCQDKGIHAPFASGGTQEQRLLDEQPSSQDTLQPGVRGGLCRLREQRQHRGHQADGSASVWLRQPPRCRHGNTAGVAEVDGNGVGCWKTRRALSATMLNLSRHNG